MEQKTVKLLNVLRRIARAAGYSQWVKADPQATRFCASQYNKVLARLSELEPALKPIFAPIADDVSPDVTRMAARELLAYFEADEPELRALKFAFGCGPRSRHRRGLAIPLAIDCDWNAPASLRCE
jgi:hypothetical protein